MTKIAGNLAIGRPLNIFEKSVFLRYQKYKASVTPSKILEMAPAEGSWSKVMYDRLLDIIAFVTFALGALTPLLLTLLIGFVIFPTDEFFGDCYEIKTRTNYDEETEKFEKVEVGREPTGYCHGYKNPMYWILAILLACIASIFCVLPCVVGCLISLCGDPNVIERGEEDSPPGNTHTT